MLSWKVLTGWAISHWVLRKGTEGNSFSWNVNLSCNNLKIHAFCTIPNWIEIKISLEHFTFTVLLFTPPFKIHESFLPVFSYIHHFMQVGNFIYWTPPPLLSIIYHQVLLTCSFFFAIALYSHRVCPSLILYPLFKELLQRAALWTIPLYPLQLIHTCNQSWLPKMQARSRHSSTLKTIHCHLHDKT